MNILNRLFLMVILLIAFEKNYAIDSLTYDTIEVKAPFPMPGIKLVKFPQRNFVITDFGAVKDSSFNNSFSIERAIAACNKAGGGRVVIPPGTWYTGKIHLQSNVNLYLSEGSLLLFSDRPSDYLPAVPTSWEGMECYNYSPLIYAYDCENIAVTGKGILRPKMSTWEYWFGRPPAHLDALRKLYTMASTDVPVEQRQMAKGENHLRPHLIQFNRCRNVLLDSFAIEGSPFWTIHMYMIDGGIARNLNVKAHGHNNDGIDIEMTRNFLVEDCTFDQGDDAIVIKAGRNRDAWRLNTPTENIIIRNCKVKKGHTMLGIGSEISGGIRNIYMYNCEAKDVNRFLFIKTNHRRGGFVENIFLEGLRAEKTDRIFEIDTDVLYQWKDLVPTYETRYTKIDGIHLNGITCLEARAVYEIKGEKKLPVENITLKNIKAENIKDFVRKIQYANNIKEENIQPNEIERR